MIPNSSIKANLCLIKDHFSSLLRGVQCVAGCGFRLFEMRFRARFAVLVPLKCGFMCGLRFHNVFGSRFSSNFDAVCGFR